MRLVRRLFDPLLTSLASFAGGRVVPLSVLAGAVASAALVTAAGGVARALPDAPDTLPLSEVKPGMKGYGLTVFSGTQPEKFDVEVISVLHNFRPSMDLILVKTPNPRLNVTRTVAGMSGSPIYIDGKMIGAYAYGWLFGVEPIAGVTPIRSMLDEQARPVPRVLFPRSGGPLPSLDASDPTPRRSPHAFLGAPDAYDLAAHAQQIAGRAAPSLAAPDGSALARASTPLLIGGMGSVAVKVASDMLTPLGLDPMQAGGGGKGAPDPDAPTKYVDGGAIGVQLVRGDVSAMGLGTVTRVAGDRLVAFGHPMLGGGIEALPTAIGTVHWIVASQNRSFKIGEAARPLGALVNDRQAAIVVDASVKAPTFPIRLEIQGVSGAPKPTWSMEVAHDQFMAPLFTAMALGSGVEETTAERRDMTWRATSKVRVAKYGTITFYDYGARNGEPVTADDLVRGKLVKGLGALLNNPWEAVTIEGIDTTVRVSFEREVSFLRGAKVLEPEVDAGSPVRIRLTLEPFQGKLETRDIEVKVPAEMAGREVEIELAPGYEIDRPLSAADSVPELMANLQNATYDPESVVATFRLKDPAAAYHGKVVSRLPPGALDTLRPATASDAPEFFVAQVHTAVPLKRFVIGHDVVHAQIRNVSADPTLDVGALPRSTMGTTPPNPGPPNPRTNKMNYRLVPARTRSAARALRALLVAAAAALLAPHAGAVGTRSFQLGSIDDLKGGDLTGVSVDSNGNVRAGLNLGALPIPDASTVRSALVVGDAVLLGTGSDGKIFRVAAGKYELFATTGAWVVTSLVVGWNGDVYAATYPDGKVFKMSADGAKGGPADTFVALPGAEDVWGLAFDAKNKALYAATGPEGKVFRIDQSGHAQVYYKSEDPNVMSVAVADDGAVYAGTSGKALLYKITGAGRASVLYDFETDDVWAVAVAPSGTVYAVANKYNETFVMPKRNKAGPPLPQPAKSTRPGKGLLMRFTKGGVPEQMIEDDDTHFTSLAIGDDGQPYVGTAAEGRLYTVDDNHLERLVAKTDERQIGAIVLSGKKRFVVGSDPAVLHEVKGVGGADAVWTSKVLDAGLRATYGRLSWRGTGAVELSIRSGNTATPDDTWNAWSPPLAAPGVPKMAPSRYTQIRARWARDPSAVLREVQLYFVTDNARTVITSIDASQRGGRSLKQGVQSSGGEAPHAGSTVKVSWKVDNPDQDEMRYRLFYRLDNEQEWRPMLKPSEKLTSAEYSWDTSALPEGTYRIMVEGTDELANPPDRVQKHTLVSGPVLVDNTPPVFKSLEIVGRRLVGEVLDGVGPIARIEVSVAGTDEWRPLFPKDGVFDQPAEAFDADVSALVPPGSHIVAVRAYDTAGNMVSRNVEAR